jgi:transposase-like protein
MQQLPNLLSDRLQQCSRWYLLQETLPSYSLQAAVMTPSQDNAHCSLEERCQELLERLRWPRGPRCPRCKTREITRISTNARIFQCRNCPYQFTVKAGTILNDSHLELSKWFVATYLISTSRDKVSVVDVKRAIGVRYGTALYLCHRIRASMTQSHYHENSNTSPRPCEISRNKSDRRKQPDIFLKTLRGLVRARPLPYRHLIATEDDRLSIAYASSILVTVPPKS